MSVEDIDSRHLSNLLSIAKHGSFNRAALAHGISQPAMSNSIAQLERHLGVQVLDRTRRGSELNEYGKILVRNAVVIEAVLEHTVDEVRLQRLGVEGPLRIGVVPSMAIKFMPTVLALLLKHNHRLAVTVAEALDDQLLPALIAGELDFVLGPLASVFPAPPEIAEEVLFDDPFSIGVGRQHPLRERPSLTLAELRDSPWILPLPGNGYRRHIEALFMAEGVPWPDNCVITSSLSLAETLLAQSDRVTIITALQSTLQNASRIRSVPLTSGGKRTIGVKWRRKSVRSALATRFMEYAHQVVQTCSLSGTAVAWKPKVAPARPLPRGDKPTP